MRRPSPACSWRGIAPLIDSLDRDEVSVCMFEAANDLIGRQRENFIEDFDELAEAIRSRFPDMYD